MKFCRIISLIVILVSAAVCYSQSGRDSDPGPIRSSPAYAEVLLRKSELEADLASFIDDYTDSNPKIVDIRFELSVLTRDIDRIFAVKPSETAKLTEALGKMIVRKAALQTDVNRIMRAYGKDHPEIKRAKRKAEVFAAAVKEILG